MEFKGTKGKWVVEKTTAKGKWIYNEDGGYCAVSAGSTSEESEANAQLIAHAPEMYQFIKDHFQYLNLDDQEKAKDLLKRTTTI